MPTLLTYESAHILGTDKIEARLLYQPAPFEQVLTITIACSPTGEADKLSLATALSFLLQQVLMELAQ